MEVHMRSLRFSAFFVLALVAAGPALANKTVTCSGTFGQVPASLQWKGDHVSGYVYNGSSVAIAQPASGLTFYTGSGSKLTLGSAPVSGGVVHVDYVGNGTAWGDWPCH